MSSGWSDQRITLSMKWFLHEIITSTKERSITSVEVVCLPANYLAIIYLAVNLFKIHGQCL